MRFEKIPTLLFCYLPFQEDVNGAVVVVEHRGESQSSEQVTAIVLLSVGFFFTMIQQAGGFLCDKIQTIY